MTTPVDHNPPYRDSSAIVGISHRDRMLAVILFVLLLHGIVILGITFTVGSAHSAQGPTFAVTLVQSHSANAPQHAHYIAQANQIGHGNTDKAVQPAAKVSEPAPLNRGGTINARDNVNQLAPAIDSKGQRITTTAAAHARRAAASDTPLARDNTSPRLLIARLMTEQADSADPTQQRKTKAQAPGKDLRVRSIAVNTTESRFARYLNAWRQQVTRTGNLNYPQAVRSRHLNGHLQLQVTLNADGSLRDATVVKPSKHPELNAAALSIVRAGAPYPPFPGSIRKDTDVLRFVYEWRFLNGHLSGR